MSLPSQSARPQSGSGRSFSSRHRRRNGPSRALVLGGGLVVLGLVIYGGLWMFGVLGGDETPTREVAGLDKTTLDDPIGAGPTVIEQGKPLTERTGTQPARGPQTNGTPAGGTVGIPIDEDPANAVPERRNILREGVENARNGGGSPAPGLTPSVSPEPNKDGNEILASDNGGARPTAVTGTAGAVAAKIAEADRLIKANEPLKARQVLNEALRSSRISSADATTLRTRLGVLNADLVFSPRVVAGDPMCEIYEIKGGDRLSNLPTKRELATHWRLIQRINGITNPDRIRLGQKLKLVRGPFHAVVDKSDFRVDIFHGAPNAPESWLYIRSFDVGLGENDGTPIGTFVVGRNAKVENPAWVNPHDSTERYGRKDPKNPIGLFWIGLEGVGDSAGYTGYGLHGTIEPESIGTQASLGCVRLRAEDIEQVYELLEEGVSVVKIVP